MCALSLFFFFSFFFSSRRRHTRYWRDWSSDVCSSDLTLIDDQQSAGGAAQSHLVELHGQVQINGGADELLAHALGPEPAQARFRSEERRVGKECRARWSPGY